MDPFRVTSLPRTLDISVPAGTDVEAVEGGRLVRTRRSLHGQLDISADQDGDLLRLTFEVRNTAPPAADKDEAIATSLIGTHLLIEVTDGGVRVAARTARCRRGRGGTVQATPLLPGARRSTGRPTILVVGVADHPV